MRQKGASISIGLLGSEEGYVRRRASSLALASVVLLPAGLLPLACGGGQDATRPEECPSYKVTIDGGASGFSSVGEWRTDAVCQVYCADGYPVCQLVDPTTVKCQRGCG